MTPSLRNRVRPAQEKGPTEAGSGAMFAMHTAARCEESVDVTTRFSRQMRRTGERTMRERSTTAICA